MQPSVMITPARRARVARILKFACVGSIGVGINTGALYVFSRWLSLPLVVASAGAVELAVISNYLLNARWTFASRVASFKRFAKFNLASLLGLGINVMAVWLLARAGIYFLDANLLGITAAFASNYALSSIWVWGQVLCRKNSLMACW